MDVQRDTDCSLLYHFTALQYVLEIIESGRLEVTASNLKKPNRSRERTYRDPRTGHPVIGNPEDDAYKPVVWLTSDPDPSGNGLDAITNGSKDLKRRVRITIPWQPEFEKWTTWAIKNRIDRKWFDRLRASGGGKSATWYICERPIPLEEVSVIEDLQTGEVLYKAEAFAPTGTDN